MKKILIIAPAWVGDMVMAQSLFKLIKHSSPDCILDVVAAPSTFLLAARMPEIRQAFKLNVQHGGLQLKQRWQMARQLRREKYDQAIILQNSWKSALIPFFAGIPVRTSWRGEMRYGLVNDMRILDKQKYPLMIQRFCMLGIAATQTLPDTLPWPALAFSNEQNVNAKILALCPGAEYGPSKRWPPNYFAQVALHYLQLGWRVWILGGPKDQAAAEEIEIFLNDKSAEEILRFAQDDNRIVQDDKNAVIPAEAGIHSKVDSRFRGNDIQTKDDKNAVIPAEAGIHFVNFVGKTSLTDAIDLLSQATMVVTNDSGLMHIAAAVQTPLVVIYGSTSPKFTPPLSHKVRILSLHLGCSPCFQRTCRFNHYHCMTQLLPHRVIQAVDESLN